MKEAAVGENEILAGDFEGTATPWIQCKVCGSWYQGNHVHTCNGGIVAVDLSGTNIKTVAIDPNTAILENILAVLNKILVTLNERSMY